MAFQRPAAEPWEMNEEEVAYISQPANVKTAPTFKCYVPKMMPALSGGAALDIPEFFDTNFLCNSPECRPTINPTVTTSNYVTVKNVKNIHWKYNTLPINGKVRIQSTGKATENLKITSKLDPTTGEDFDLEMAIKVVIFHETGELPDLPSHVDAGI